MNRAYFEGVCRGIMILADSLLIADCVLSLRKKLAERKAAKAAKQPEAEAANPQA